MSRLNIISVVPVPDGIIVTFETKQGPISYFFNEIQAALILSGVDPRSLSGDRL